MLTIDQIRVGQFEGEKKILNDLPGLSLMVQMVLTFSLSRLRKTMEVN